MERVVLAPFSERARYAIISQLIPPNVSLRRAGVEQLYQVKRMLGGIGNVSFSTFSQT